jgi:hypothetical protein
MNANPVCPELVEGLPFLSGSERQKREGFDRLSPNGVGGFVPRIAGGSRFRLLYSRVHPLTVRAELVEALPF